MTKQKTFEGAMTRLEEIVRELENGELGLDDSLKKFQEGMNLSSFCARKLDETEKKVSLLLQHEDGSVSETDFQKTDTDRDKDTESAS